MNEISEVIENFLLNSELYLVILKLTASFLKRRQLSVAAFDHGCETAHFVIPSVSNTTTLFSVHNKM